MQVQRMHVCYVNIFDYPQKLIGYHADILWAIGKPASEANWASSMGQAISIDQMTVMTRGSEVKAGMAEVIPVVWETNRWNCVYTSIAELIRD